MKRKKLKLFNFDNGERYDQLLNRKGNVIYSIALIFCLCYSYLVYGLQFLNSEIRYVYIYLTNWTFTLFLITTSLEGFRMATSYWLSRKVKLFIFNVTLITRPTYIFVCLFYSASLMSAFVGFGEFLNESTNLDEKNNVVFYFNDISKHFIFVALLIVLFVFAQRETDEEFSYKWWKFIYSLTFIISYLFFALAYYHFTSVKIYNISNVSICILVTVLPVVIFLIHMVFKIVDERIRKTIFSEEEKT